ncbi:RAB6-interacting golgin isoform X2 [Pezoporus occidentalis]|uniref:RAB6-interacting golgin isoform X2 n=1 Tax=Pezoporus occidentalis TaxID=407982 RepID=UPI002F907EA6
MAEAWAGFSQEELRRLRAQRPDLYEPSEQQHHPHTTNKSRKQSLREKALQQQCRKLGLQGGAASVPPEQLLSVPKHKPCHPQQLVPPPHPPSAGDQRQNDNQDQQKEVTPVDPCNGSDSVHTHPAKPSSKVEKKKVELQEKSRWEILQQEQRLIEEKNKRKKALLAKAIAERSKRTQAETVKLKRIQKELQALDDMVSADIGILRNRIDQASLDYSYARLCGYPYSPLHLKCLHSEIFAFTYCVCDPRGGCFELITSREVPDDNPSGHSWREPEGDFLMRVSAGEGIWDGCNPQTHQTCKWLLSRGSKTLIQSPL